MFGSSQAFLGVPRPTGLPSGVQEPVLGFLLFILEDHEE